MNLTQNYALVALNALDSKRMTTGKKVSLYCMGAGVILELYLENKFIRQGDKLGLSVEILKDRDITMYQEFILKPFFKKESMVEGNLKWWIDHASQIPYFQLKKFEKVIVDSLVGADVMEEIPNLLGCDLEFTSAGLSMREYRTKASEYTRQFEGFRADLLEEIPLTDEIIMLYWMYRESGCMGDLFSKEEIKKIDEKMNQSYLTDSLSKSLLAIQTSHWMDKTMSAFIKKKKEIFSTPIGTGVAFAYPILDRAQTVFIETEEYAAGPSARLTDITNKLVENGHDIDVLRISGIPLIKIDNIVYEALPTQKMYRFPVFGVQLRRYRV